MIRQAFNWFRIHYRLYAHVDGRAAYRGVFTFDVYYEKLPGDYQMPIDSLISDMVNRFSNTINTSASNTFRTYEEAELACLDYMCEVVNTARLTLGIK